MKKQPDFPLSQINACTGCNACSFYCPFFMATHKEAWSPAGVMTLLKEKLKTGQISELQQAVLDFCTLCGKCKCPANIPLAKIFFRIKVQTAPSSYTRLIRLGFSQKPIGNLLTPLSKIKKGKNFKNNIPFIHYSRKKPGQKKILFFPGCQFRQNRPDLARKAVRIIKEAGFICLSPFRLKCCSSNRGWPEKFVTQNIKKNLELIAKVQPDYIVTGCPSCKRAITEFWPDSARLSRKEMEQARFIANNTLDMATFLKKYSNFACNVAGIIFHKPCASEKEDFETLLSLFPNLKEKKIIDECCGGKCGEIVNDPALQVQPPCGDWQKNLLSLSQPLSVCDQIKKNFRSHFSYATGIVVTSCLQCAQEMNSQFDKNWNKIRVVHFLEVLGKK